MRVTRRFRRPRAKTETITCGAWTFPSGPGTDPGLIVKKENSPPASVPERPKPEKSSCREMSSLSSVVLHRGGVPSFQHDVEPVAKGPFRLCCFDVERRDHALSRLRISHGLADRIVLEQRVAREVHLGYEAAPERRPEEREVYMCRAPGVVVILPGIGPRLYRHEPVAALGVR